MRTSLILAASAAALIPVSALASETITYGYDAKGRLVSVAHTGTVNGGLTATYVYDPADNRSAVTVIGGNDPTGSPPASPPAPGPIPPGQARAGLVVVPLNGFTVIPFPPS